MASDLRIGVNNAFAAEGIQIPFPQRDLHLRSIDPRVQAALAGGDPTDPPAAVPGEAPVASPTPSHAPGPSDSRPAVPQGDGEAAGDDSDT